MIEQRSEEWSAEKLGAITGTRAHELLSSDTTRKTLMAKLLREFALANTKDVPQTPAMARGAEIEDEAASYYSFINNCVVTGQKSYIVSERHPFFAVSPDGLVNERAGLGVMGGLEIKRLDEENHIKVLVANAPEKKYINQCKWGMFVTGRDWWDYFGYCESLPEPLRHYQLRIFRNESEMKAIEKTALKFVDELTYNLKRFGLLLEDAA